MRGGRHLHDDEGAVLPMTLVCLAFLGLVIVGLLGQSDVSLRTSAVVSVNSKKLYGADGGLDVGLEAIKDDDSLCPQPTADFRPVATYSVPGHGNGAPDAGQVVVECRTFDGDARGVGGFAVVATSNDNNALTTQSGSDKTVQGSIFVRGGIDLKKRIIVEGGHVRQTGSPCRYNFNTGEELRPTPSPPWNYQCINPSTQNPVINQALPAKPGGPAQSPNGTGPTTCKIFEPGRYTSAPVLGLNNYFKSGVYAFENIGPWNITAATVYGGSRGSEPRLLGGGETAVGLPCFSEPNPNPAGDGVRFVLEGTSSISVGTGGEVELFSHRPPTSDGSARRASIQTVPAGAGGGWIARTATVPALNTATGSPQVVIHGSIVAPGASLSIFATNEVVAQALNGVLADKVDLQSSASGRGLGVSIQPDNSSRKMLLRATASGASTGERPTVATAVVEIYNDENRTLLVRSRRVG